MNQNFYYVNGLNYTLQQSDGIWRAYENQRYVAGSESLEELQSKLTMIEKANYSIMSLIDDI